MHYPFLITDEDCEKPVCKNLNENIETWQPARNSPLGSDFRAYLTKILRTVLNHHSSARQRKIMFSLLTELSRRRMKTHRQKNSDLTASHIYSVRHIIIFRRQQLIWYNREVYDFIGHPVRQFDDMTAVLIDVPHDTSCHEKSNDK